MSAYNPIQSFLTLTIATLLCIATQLSFVLSTKAIPVNEGMEVQTTNQNAPLKILVLNSYHEGYIWTDRVMQSIKEEFKRGDRVELFVSYMDTKRYVDTTYFNLLSILYRSKYRHINFDGIIASDDNALHFLLKYRDKLFPQVPVAFCGINNFSQELLKGHKGYTGIKEQYDVKSTIELVKTFHPEITTIAFISDDTYTGRVFNEQFKNIEPLLDEHIKPIYFFNTPFKKLCSSISQLPDNSAIIWGSYLKNSDNELLSVEESIDKTIQCSNSPIYCLWDIVGLGVVGGSITSPNYQGQRTVKLLRQQIKAGIDVQIPIEEGPRTYKVDYKIIKKYNIPEERIPPESEIINKPVTAYSLYKKEIWTTIIVIVILSIIIFVLLLLIRKLRIAEKLLRIKNKALRDSQTELIKSNEKLEVAKEKAEESERLKTSFLANISHEIRTPMNGILGFADLLNNKDLPVNSQTEYLAIIQKSGHRLLALINDLVDISKIDTGQIKIFLTPVQMGIFMEQLHTLHFPEAHKKNLIFTCDTDDSLANKLVLLDIQRTEQVLNNLITNAFKFTKAGQITIGATLKDNQILFWVKDTGSGIAKEFHSLIFDRFRQVEDTHLREEEGSGLGLSISKELVQLMNGKIWLESEVGKGSTFFIRLPFTEEESNTTKQQNNTIPLVFPADFKLLIAEDDDISYRLLKYILKDYKLQIIRACNGQEAVDLFRKTPDISLVLSDLKMPIINGIEAVKEIRKINSKVPVIFQSAYTSNINKDEIFKVGCDDILNKPIQKDLLLNSLGTILKQRQTK